MDKITFEGIDYPVRHIELSGYGVQMISVETLEDALLVDGCDYVSEEAGNIDEQIYFYVPDEIMDDEQKVMSYINRHWVG